MPHSHADYYTEMYQLSGCKMVTVTAKLNKGAANKSPVQLLCGDAYSDCPLDIIAELMVCHEFILIVVIKHSLLPCQYCNC